MIEYICYGCKTLVEYGVKQEKVFCSICQKELSCAIPKSTIIVGLSNVERVRLLSLKAGLKLEVLGMRRSGKSIYAIVKSEFGFKGNRQRVLNQLTKYIAEQNQGKLDYG